ncbi:hypothetical protein CAC42_3159 [Sphaceloma murrayae]|uniref:C2H2-type domain-containing protein n=1 Tax=Sphaceloma murrayae TaxID=2082308 RepID=A0A2K1QRQ9_9PEZI|nr:hypothetical protein CAC42_3159 [Sphaceloma murrayae]
MPQKATPPRTDQLAPVDRLAPSTPTSLPPSDPSAVGAKGLSPKRLAPNLGTPSLSPKAVHRGLSPRSSPQPLTGAAALADARRAQQEKEARAARQVSPNPNLVALNALMGTKDMSRQSDAPATSQLSEPLKTIAEKITVPVTNGSGSPKLRSNGTSITSRTTGGAEPMNTTATASPQDAPQFVEEPESMDDNHNDHHSHQDDATRPFTYPGPASHLQPNQEGSRRDLSYDSGSKSAKRHKCPYCSTDFTRHHNLKSHLLTHSQEKPYVCQTCQARFRRLHDLKRHTKLHTGERPHTCPKCGRKFARGDALARHNKGPGGCANRKSSFGGGDDDDGGDDTMDGLEYEQDQDDQAEDSEMLDAQGRRVSEPNRKRPHPDSSPHDPRAPYRQHSSTYPPPPMGNMGRVVREPAPMAPPPSMLSPGSKPPPSEHHSGLAQHNDQPSYSSHYYPQPQGSSYPPPAVTESPRPLSPRAPDQHRLSVSDPQGLRNRSPSLNSNYHSPQYGRGSIPSMPPAAHMTGSHPQQLPSLPSIAAHHAVVQPPQPVQPPSYPSHHHHQSHAGSGGPSSSNPGSHSSHGHSSSGSIRDILGPDPGDLVTYVRSLESRMSRMQDEYELRLGRLQADVIELKKQAYEKR